MLTVSVLNNDMKKRGSYGALLLKTSYRVNMTLSELINKYYENLNKNDIYLCQYISNHKKECSKMTIDELSSRCNISRSSILRFAQKLSLNGYSELKVYLKLETENVSKAERDILTEVCDDYHRMIDDFKSRDFKKVCQMIYEAKRVFVYGTGSMQTSVAREMQRKFIYMKKCINTVEGKGEMVPILDMLTHEDVVIIISHSGESEQVISCAKEIKIRNIPLIAIIKMKINPLARLSDETLYAGTSLIDSTVNDNYETSMLFFMLTEILLVKYMLYKGEIESALPPNEK